MFLVKVTLLSLSFDSADNMAALEFGQFGRPFISILTVFTQKLFPRPNQLSENIFLETFC